MEGKPGGNWPSADKEQMCALGLGPCSVGSFPSLQVGRDPQDPSLPDPRLLNRIPTPTAQAGPPLHRELVSRSEKQRLRLTMSACQHLSLWALGKTRMLCWPQHKVLHRHWAAGGPTADAVASTAILGPKAPCLSSTHPSCLHM